MIGCLISLVIAAIFAIIVIWALEYIVRAVGPVPTQVFMLVRLLVALLILLYGLNCIFAAGGGFPHLEWR